MTTYLRETFKSLHSSATIFWPGIVLSACIAFTALFLSNHYGGPAFLFALLVGISVNFVRQEKTFIPGIDLTSKLILRIGVALLGLRIGVDELATLGLPSIIVVILALILTILFGLLCAKMLNQSYKMGLLVGGATAICGASAALAISCCLAHYANRERDTLFTVVIVTTLSTIAMALYPVITGMMNLNDVQAGFFIGATIHDVAQVVGAGYSISHEAGDISIVTKLLRVACLVPVVFILTFAEKAAGNETGEGTKTPLLPWFLIAFIILAAIHSLHLVPQQVIETTNHVSRFLLLMAVAAIGTKTYLGDIAEIGWKALTLPVMTTVFLAMVIAASVSFLPL